PASAALCGFTFALETHHNNRLNPALGGGSLWDVGSYPVTYSQHIAGHEAKVVFGTAHWHESGVDEEFTGMLRFDAGMTANIYAGFRTPYRTWLEILGTHGALTVPNPFRPGPMETLELEQDGVMKHIGVAGSPQIFVREIEDFEASVLDGRPTVVTLGASRRTAATLTKLYAAARGK